MEEFCTTAPSAEMAHGCAGGLFHTWAKYFVERSIGDNWAWPCDNSRLPAPCFRTLVIEGRLPTMFKTWVANNRPSTNFFPEACQQLHSEQVVRGCINGMAYFMYRSSQTLSSSIEQIISCGAPEIYAGDPMADVKTSLVDLTKSMPQKAQAGNALQLLCSIFVVTQPVRDLNEVERLRWLACVHGSVWNDVSTNVDMMGIPRLAVFHHCEQLLRVSWQLNTTFRAQAMALCVRTALIDKENANVSLFSLQMYETWLFNA